jgi:hypothetical protein
LIRPHYHIISVFLCLNFFFHASAQKFEKEKKVNYSDVPDPALTYIENCCKNLSLKRFKWVKEINESSFHYEAKFFYLHHEVSVEFDNWGKIIDAEITINKKDVPSDVLKNIFSDMKKAFKKFKILKIQIGFDEISSEQLQKILEKQDYQKGNRYEIVIKARNISGYSSYYEITFNQNGFLIKKERIIEKVEDDYTNY